MNRFVSLLFVTSLLAVTATAAVQLEGYLLDRHSADARIVDGNNLLLSPEKHNAGDASTTAAESSGYILVEAATSATATTFAKITNFTDNSNKKAVAFLRSLPASRTNLKVRINVVSASTELVEISDLAVWDVGMATGTTHTFIGYIVDRICLDKIRGFDGAHMMNEPEAHTAHCLIYAPCVASGMALLLKKGINPSTNAPDAGYGAIYNFTAASNDEIVAWGRTLGYHQNNLFMEFTGTIDTNGVITRTSTFQQATPAPPPQTTEPTPNPETPMPTTSVPETTFAPTSSPQTAEPTTQPSTVQSQTPEVPTTTLTTLAPPPTTSSSGVVPVPSTQEPAATVETFQARNLTNATLSSGFRDSCRAITVFILLSLIL